MRLANIRACRVKGYVDVFGCGDMAGDEIATSTQEFETGISSTAVHGRICTVETRLLRL